MMNGYYTVEVRDREGKLLKRIRCKSRSYVKQWNQLVYVQCEYASGCSMKDIAGATATVTAHAYNFGMGASAGNTNQGIVFGTGSTAVTISDYVLAGFIAHGTGSGALSYLASAFSAPVVSGSTCYFLVTRTAVNNSGATISVAEIGIHMLGRPTGANAYYLAIRDVLPTPLNVPNGGAITVVYTLKATV